ncbi:MAG: calcium/sodium antiporter [Rickettsiales bacterium]|jgi:cation:H+ antiporter|nr:calcium/sodium antiporter [Rickettsiales bacterium]
MLILGEIIFGLILLFIGGESVVRAAIKISDKFNIPKAFIGLTIVAYATSTPELLITLFASLGDHHQIALGNVIGSNITNTLLIFGVCALIHPVQISKKTINFDIKYLVISNFALILFASLGVITKFEGFALIFMLITYTFVTYKLSFKSNDLLAESNADMPMPFKIKLSVLSALALFVIGLIFLIIGSKVLILGAVSMAMLFNIPESVVAVTIIAIGGSAPEISTSIIAALRKQSDLAVGNIVGSNIFNILGVLGITSLIKPMPTISTTLSHFDIWVMLISAIFLYAISYAYRKISRLSGILFLFMYALYLAWEVSLIL